MKKESLQALWLTDGIGLDEAIPVAEDLARHKVFELESISFHIVDSMIHMEFTIPDDKENDLFDHVSQTFSNHGFGPDFGVFFTVGPEPDLVGPYNEIFDQ